MESIATFCKSLDLPALVLVFLLGWFFFIFIRIQRSNNGFDMKQMLCENNGKPSLSRLGNMVALAVSSWAVMYHVIHSDGKVEPTFLIGYFAVYAGTQTANKFFEQRSSNNSNSGSYWESPPHSRSENERDSSQPITPHRTETL